MLVGFPLPINIIDGHFAWQFPNKCIKHRPYLLPWYTWVNRNMRTLQVCIQVPQGWSPDGNHKANKAASRSAGHLRDDMPTRQHPPFLPYLTGMGYTTSPGDATAALWPIAVQHLHDTPWPKQRHLSTCDQDSEEAYLNVHYSREPRLYNLY